ncbi:MAG: hypothetical protein ACN4GW_06550 [Desulforhopalus sp.]
MMSSNFDQLFENEWYIVRHSGETPEIAYNSAIYYLTRAKDGPRVELTDKQYNTLKEAAVIRYGEIVLRDLHHSNHKKKIYRGVERSRVNFSRFCAFCDRQQLDSAVLRRQAAETLQLFLETELQLLQGDRPVSIINCSFNDLQNYAIDLGIVLDEKYQYLEKYCP